MPCRLAQRFINGSREFPVASAAEGAVWSGLCDTTCHPLWLGAPMLPVRACIFSCFARHSREIRQFHAGPLMCIFIWTDGREIYSPRIFVSHGRKISLNSSSLCHYFRLSSCVAALCRAREKYMNGSLRVIISAKINDWAT